MAQERDIPIPSDVLTYDLETTTLTHMKRKASPFCPDNWVVAAGYKRDDGAPFGVYFTNKESSLEHEMPFEPTTKLLVGFNIKFDLLWMWHRPELQAFFRNGGKIWDCQYVEYLLEGQAQHAQYASMDSCVEKYGGTLKIDAVKELWNAGVNTPDIDETLLMDYLLGNEEDEIEGDVNNTFLIFKGQYERAAKIHPNFMAMLERRMDGLLATTDAEYNGLYIDRERGEADRAVLAVRRDELSAKLWEFLPELPPELTFNWNSIYHKSYLIYGGTAAYERWVHHEDPDGPGGLAYARKTEKWPLFGGTPCSPDECTLTDGGLYQRLVDSVLQDTYQSGKRKGEGKTKNVQTPDLTKPKGAKQAFGFKFKGFTKPDRNWESTLTDFEDKPIYSTASEIIEHLAATRSDVPFLALLGERQKVQKDLGTYYWDYDPKKDERKGMLCLVGDDSIIHHKLNHTATITTRLSGSDPNMQNIPRGDKSQAKAMFASRFGKKGVMAEIDYSQLEVVIQALLSRDPQMIADLNNGVDFHCKRLAKKLSTTYEAVKDAVNAGDPKMALLRTAIKGFTFQRAYGAGPTAIAASTGMEVEEVEQLITDEERMYPGVVAFDNIVEQSIQQTSRTTSVSAFVDGQRFQLQEGEWFSPTGTRYLWREHEAPKFLWKHGKFVGFSPTERKNWPVQGDGGFVVQAMIGYIFRLFNKTANFGGKALFVNTVHDCAWFDFADMETAQAVLPKVRAVLEAVPTMYKRSFGIDVPVPFPTETEVGPNMLELTHFH